ncbi:uncharacterized protein VP01_14903g1, partial [Puccinia sorghi]
KTAVFFAAEQSIFAKHVTTYLTSWNVYFSHMPYKKSKHDISNPTAPQAAAAEVFSKTETCDPEKIGSADLDYTTHDAIMILTITSNLEPHLQAPFTFRLTFYHINHLSAQ